jgi:hypothetical protein
MIVFKRYFSVFIQSLTLVLALILTSSCRKEDNGGKLIFVFGHKVGDERLVKDTVTYLNAAENEYVVNELQYFISDITLWQGGESHTINSDNGVHYVDLDIPATLSWTPQQVFPAGTYDSISFTFGLNEVRNVSGYFVNPPERDMFWPDIMGGGYHIMKMNGKWKSPLGEVNPFNLHLGIGMVTDTSGNETFVQNYFTVTLPLTGCEVHETQIYRQFTIDMDINSWFESPYYWDWNIMGGQIMQNQDAMRAAAINGRDAFSISYEAPKPK